MNWLPPFWMRLRISKTQRAGFGVWLPVFLLWPLWFLALLMFLVAALVATAATGSRNFRGAIAATRELHLVASGLRGARLELQRSRGKQLSFSFV
jgi:hypothetical protein